MPIARPKYRPQVALASTPRSVAIPIIGRFRQERILSVLLRIGPLHSAGGHRAYASSSCHHPAPVPGRGSALRASAAIEPRITHAGQK